MDLAEVHRTVFCPLDFLKWQNLSRPRKWDDALDASPTCGWRRRQKRQKQEKQQRRQKWSIPCGIFASQSLNLRKRSHLCMLMPARSVSVGDPEPMSSIHITCRWHFSTLVVSHVHKTHAWDLPLHYLDSVDRKYSRRFSTKVFRGWTRVDSLVNTSGSSQNNPNVSLLIIPVPKSGF